jgi:hypothetical protein
MDEFTQHHAATNEEFAAAVQSPEDYAVPDRSGWRIQATDSRRFNSKAWSSVSTGIDPLMAMCAGRGPQERHGH